MLTLWQFSCTECSLSFLPSCTLKGRTRCNSNCRCRAAGCFSSVVWTLDSAFRSFRKIHATAQTSATQSNRYIVGNKNCWYFGNIKLALIAPLNTSENNIFGVLSVFHKTWGFPPLKKCFADTHTGNIKVGFVTVQISILATKVWQWFLRGRISTASVWQNMPRPGKEGGQLS